MNFKNQKGFSIIQGLMLAGLLSGTALVTSKLISDQKKAAVSAESKDAIDELDKMVLNFMTNQDNCTETITANGATALSGRRSLSTLRVVNRAIGTGNNDVVTSSQIILQAGNRYFSEDIQVKQMFIDYGTYSGGTSTATLEIHLSRNEKENRTKDGFGSKDFIKKFNIAVRRNGTAFDGCYAVKNQDTSLGEYGNAGLIKSFCQSLGSMFEWVEAQNICRIRDNICPPGQFFAGITSTGVITDLVHIHYALGGGSISDYQYGQRGGITSVGQANCRAPRQAIRIEQLIDESPVDCVNRHGVRFIKSGTKVRITCI